MLNKGYVGNNQEKTYSREESRRQNLPTGELSSHVSRIVPPMVQPRQDLASGLKMTVVDSPDYMLKTIQVIGGKMVITDEELTDDSDIFRPY